MKSRFALIFTVYILLSLPMVSAVPSGLTYLDSTWSSNDGEDGELIAINSNRTILASYHGDEIILFNTTSFEQLGSFSFDEEVFGMEFNPNGTVLAINKRSTVQLRESIRLIDIEAMEVMDSSVLADDNFRDITWSVDGQLIAAQGADGDVEQYRFPGLSLKNTLHGVHVVDVTCIAYRSDGEYILTGDESGRWAIWNLLGERQGTYREFDEGLVDCKFTPDGMDILLLGEDGKITSRIYGSSEKHNDQIDGAKEIYFSESGTRMHISVESNNFKGLLTYDYETFNEIQRTTFFHRVDDIAFIEDEYSRIQTLFVSGGIGEVAVYLRELIPEGFNVPGADLDGDFIPDNLDYDDDGDGIIDEWDDDIGCDAPEGTPCSRYPDLSKIRNIEINVGEYFVVRDQITLPTEDSSNIRNLSRNSIATDQVLSSHEADLFGNAMCANMDHGDIIDQWSESISLSNGELGDASVDCTVIDGMELVRDGDSTTQITLMIITTFTYDSKVTLPLEITLNQQPLPTDGSVGWLAPAHPIALTFSGDKVTSKEIPLWWNNGEDVATVTMTQVSVKNPTVIDNVLDWAFHPIAFILYLGVLAGIVTLWIRRENRIDFDLADEEDDIDDLQEEIEEELEEEFIEEISKEEYIEEDLEIQPKRTPPARKRSMYTTSVESTPLVKKKRVSGSELNKDGPIMKTKRKRLVSTEEAPKVVAKKRVVAISEPKIKKRKVKAHKEEPAPKEKKKRKSVKRKKKGGSKKKIDEKQLQEDLVSDFLNKD